LVRLADEVPSLRIVLDHTPQLNPPEDPEAHRKLRANLRELAARPHIYFKLSAVLRPVNGRVPLDLDFYRSRLEELWDTFGEDRVLYGSDWPNSDTKGTYQQGFKVIHEFVGGKSRTAQEKFFWKNSVHAYGWVKRTAEQPQTSPNS
jgi:predicted TIM-barrel fold metal-dependent hydrolase